MAQEAAVRSYNSERIGSTPKACLLGAFLAIFALAGLARGEIITDPTAVSLGSGCYEDSASYSLASIIQSGGLVIGDKRFDLFSIVTTKSKNAVASGADEITLTAVYIDGDYGFKVNGLWLAGASQWADSTLSFHASILDSYIAQGYAFKDNTLWLSGYGVSTNASGGMVSIAENIYPSAAKKNALANEYVYYTSEQDNITEDSAVFTPATQLWVVKDIAVFGGGGTAGSAHLSEFYQTFSQTVPEPGTLVLLGVGGLGLVGFAMRRRRRLSENAV
jgi:hypothetical protein